MTPNEIKKHLDILKSCDEARKILNLPIKTFKSRLYNTENVRIFIANNGLILTSKDIA